MSKIKKILAVLMTLAMVLGMSMTTMAAESATITVNNLDDKATISYLQVIAPNPKKETGWEFIKDSEAEAAFKKSFGDTLTDQEIIWKLIKYADAAAKVPEGTEAATAAEINNALINLDTTKYTPVTGNEIIANVAGVYAIHATTTGDFVYNEMAAYVSFTYTTAGVPNGLNDATVNAKKVPTKVEKTSDEKDSVTSIKDEVTYTVTTTIPFIGEHVETKLFTITDTISGAEYKVTDNKVAVEIYLNGATTPADTKNVDVASTIDGKQTFTIDLTSYTTNNTYANKTLVLKYKAIVTGEKVENTVQPGGGDHEYASVTNTLYTGKITMTKTGEANETLAGAGFVIYRENGTTKEYALVSKDSKITDANQYVVTAWTTDYEAAKVDNNLIMTDSNGEAVVRGLDSDTTYKFEEIKAPNGYSINETDSVAKWDSTSAVDARTGNADMTDTKLSSLPSTGGIGTTIFTIGGCLIMIVAAALFFASRKKSAK